LNELFLLSFSPLLYHLALAHVGMEVLVKT